MSYIEKLGVPIHERRNNDGLAVFDVKISLQNHFFRSMATTNLAFPLHTDCADFEAVPNCIGLLCVEPADKEQGSNTFAFLNDILKNLSAEKTQWLLDKQWKFRTQMKSILSLDNETYKICYDRITMESFTDLNDAEIAELKLLNQLFEAESFKIKLKKGDLILFRNDLMLHGRDQIDFHSKRFIKRIRFHIN